MVDLKSCVVANFGLAQIIPKNGYMHGFSGTKHFIAPEVRSGQYNEKVYIWSTGVLAFFLLMTEYPSLLNVKNDIESLEISDSLRRLLFSLFENNPNSRISASDAL